MRCVFDALLALKTDCGEQNLIALISLNWLLSALSFQLSAEGWRVVVANQGRTEGIKRSAGCRAGNVRQPALCVYAAYGAAVKV